MQCILYKVYCNLDVLFSFKYVLLAVLWSNSGFGITVGKNTNSEGTDFKLLVLSGTFVDKSLLISEILARDEKVFHITRPRKWGKTINLQMLKHFFEVECDRHGILLAEGNKVNNLLFKGGQIITDKGKSIEPLKIYGVNNAVRHFGKQPVIFLSLKNVKGNSVGEFEESLKRVVVELFLSYPFLEKYISNGSSLLDEDEKIRLNNFFRGTLDEEYIYDCLEFLSMLLYEHFHSYICLFIDDYDVPIISAFLKFGDRAREFKYLVEIFRMFFGYAFKENQYLLKGIITGTLNFDVVPSGISEFEYRYILYNTVLDIPFSKFYGFTKEEVEHLFKKAELRFVPSDVQMWYGGLFLNDTEIYNPWSVTQLLSNKGHFDYYLHNSAKTDLVAFLDRAFLSDAMLEYLHLLSEGKEIIRNILGGSVSLRSVAADFYSVFVHAGYLKQIPPELVNEKPIWRMKIPNLEIRGIFATGFKQWVAKELNTSLVEYNSFVDLLVTQKIEGFGKRLQELLSSLNKYNAKTEEQCYHNLMVGISASLGIGYLVESIKEFGDNRGESVIIPLENHGKFAIDIEYNVCKPWQHVGRIVNSSLEGFLHRPKICSAKIRAYGYITDILYVAVGLSGQKVTVKSQIVNIR